MAVANPETNGILITKMSNVEVTQNGKYTKEHGYLNDIGSHIGSEFY
jgi:hypothetical protein